MLYTYITQNSALYILEVLEEHSSYLDQKYASYIASNIFGRTFSPLTGKKTELGPSTNIEFYKIRQSTNLADLVCPKEAPPIPQSGPLTAYAVVLSRETLYSLALCKLLVPADALRKDCYVKKAETKRITLLKEGNDVTSACYHTIDEYNDLFFKTGETTEDTLFDYQGHILRNRGIRIFMTPQEAIYNALNTQHERRFS